MRVGEPVHAVKFMVKVREEHAEDANGVLRDCVVPVFGRSGFGEVLIVARRRQLDKLDPEGPGVVESPVLKRLLENAPPDLSVLTRRVRWKSVLHAFCEYLS